MRMRSGWVQWACGLWMCTVLSVASAQAPTAPSGPVPPPPPAASPPAAVTTTQWSASTEDASEPAPLRDVSLTFSPLHLLIPIVEVTAEMRVHDNVGIAVLAGGGRMTLERSDGSKRAFTVFELGASLRAYAIGDFDHGMQLGLEALWVHVSMDKEAGVTGTGAGLAVGPMIGYKYTARNGFTFDGQLGVQWLAIHAKATNGVDSASKKDSDLVPLLNLNVGWSF